MLLRSHPDPAGQFSNEADGFTVYHCEEDVTVKPVAKKYSLAHAAAANNETQSKVLEG